LRNFTKKPSVSSSCGPRSRTRAPEQYFRPVVEVLEDRLAPNLIVTSFTISPTSLTLGNSVNFSLGLSGESQNQDFLTSTTNGFYSIFSDTGVDVFNGTYGTNSGISVLLGGPMFFGYGGSFTPIQGSHTYHVNVVDNFTGSASRTDDSGAIVASAATTTSISFSVPSPIFYGEPDTVFVSVSPKASTPPSITPATGTVNFFIYNSSFSIFNPFALNQSLSSGATSAGLPTTPVGSYTVEADYFSNNANFQDSFATVSPFTIVADNTSTALADSGGVGVPHTVSGQPVTLTATVSNLNTGATPIGSVQFQVTNLVTFSTTTIGTVALNGSGAAMINVPNTDIPAGIYSFTATYLPGADGSGVVDFTGSAAGITHVVDKANTTAALAASPASPTSPGTNVTFTATITPVSPGSTAAAPVGGTANFYLDTSTSGTPAALNVPVVNGVAQYTNNTLTLGSHTLIVQYNGDGNFNGSTSNTLTQAVLATTQTTVSSSSNPSFANAPLTFTAVVVGFDPMGSTPTGTVTFSDGATPLGTVGLSAGIATLNVSTLSVTGSPHQITAQYSGSPFFAGSTSSALAETILTTPTSTTLTSSPLVSVTGQPVVFTATVTSIVGGTVPLPSGSVTFVDTTTSTTLGSPTLTGDSASVTVSTLGVGNHVITATFNPTTGSGYGESSATIPQLVTNSDTNTTLTATPNPANQGNLVTMTATVAPVLPGTGNPTGTVTFFNGGTSLGTGTVSGGVATLSTSTLPVGADSLTAVYSGDTNFNTSTSAPLTETVGPAALGTSLAIQSTVSPSIFGQPVTFTATVTPVSGTVTPTGSVIFTDTTLNPQLTLGTGTLNAAGQATVTVSSLEVNTAGHTIQASYIPTGNFAASSATLTQNINSAATTTALSAAPPAISVGQSVTFTATVSVTAPGAGPATGNVQFFVDNFVTPVATSPLGANGTATYTASALTVGAHNVSATYVPNANSLGGFDFLTSSSQTISESVGPATPTVVLTPPPNPNPVGLGSPVTISATVTPPTANGIAPTGFVQFFDNGIPIGGNVTIPASSPGPVTVSTTTSALPQGSDVLTAFYSGDASYNSGTSAPVTEMVQGAIATATALTATPPSPTTTGQSVTLNATVTHPGTTPPTGTITFQDGGTVLQTVPISAAGTASFTVASPTAGSHTYSANYSGDSLYSPSSASVVQAVQAAQTTITLSTSGTPAMVGRPVTFAVAVAPVSPATGTPTGTVTFFDNGTAIGTATLNNGAATFTTSSLARGNHSITASYNGDPNFLASTTTTALSQFIANVGFIFTR
jgi:hypothetical protein